MSKYQADSFYCYKGTDILKNKLGLRDPDALEKAENLYTMFRLGQLSEQPPPHTFDVQSLKDIHQYIFQDIYDFAGEFRQEGIAKGSTVFAHPRFIDEEAKRIFTELSRDRYLTNCSKKEFAEKAAYYAAELNALHPFREGNGRAIREFLRQLAIQSNYELDWQNAKEEELLHAFIRSYNLSLTELSNLILDCLE
ncbi:cell filamentation protein Fic [Bacillus aerolatus]|uniref:protein adenylyltransferase n=1 Tax=Bacillus aerolatus TaxID=2653354 RepID=A0A6I1FJ48_9BACI|nr:Fic family protein [Bacillus aerolatus]KAB7705954.1 cell filamentation protein Fic [Bacillus aerolatus]